MSPNSTMLSSTTNCSVRCTSCWRWCAHRVCFFLRKSIATPIFLHQSSDQQGGLHGTSDRRRLSSSDSKSFSNDFGGNVSGSSDCRRSIAPGRCGPRQADSYCPSRNCDRKSRPGSSQPRPSLIRRLRGLPPEQPRIQSSRRQCRRTF